MIRAKENTQFRITHRNKRSQKNIKADCVIKFTGIHAVDYPDELRFVKFYDEEKKSVYSYLTNMTHLSARTIADIYKARWDIELFFKWIKQNLEIKKFYGTSENAVKFQIWIAMLVYLIVAWLKFKSKSSLSILKIFRNLSDNVFSGETLERLLHPPGSKKNKIISDNQLSLNLLGQQWENLYFICKTD